MLAFSASLECRRPPPLNPLVQNLKRPRRKLPFFKQRSFFLPRLLQTHRQHLLTNAPLSLCRSKARLASPRRRVANVFNASPVQANDAASGVSLGASDLLARSVHQYLSGGGEGVGERIHLSYHKDLHGLKDAVARDLEDLLPYAKVTAECVGETRKELRVSLGATEEVVFDCTGES